MSPPGEAYAEVASNVANKAVQSVFLIAVSTDKISRPECGANYLKASSCVTFLPESIGDKLRPGRSIPQCSGLALKFRFMARSTSFWGEELVKMGGALIEQSCEWDL
jgi:hypothetical protein